MRDVNVHALVHWMRWLFYVQGNPIQRVLLYSLIQYIYIYKATYSFLPLAHSHFLSLSLSLSLSLCLSFSLHVSVFLSPSLPSYLPPSLLPSFLIALFPLCFCRINNHPSSAQHLSAQCTYTDLSTIASWICSWEMVAPYLGITPSEEQTIKKNYSGYGEQKYKMLLLWKEKLGKSATYGKLIEIFEKNYNKEMADHIKDLVSEMQGCWAVISFHTFYWVYDSAQYVDNCTQKKL